jgi:hypothetical protein
MSIRSIALRATPLLGIALLVSGCTTAVNITSNPPGAHVFARGSGRAAYHWEKKGQAPVAYKSWYSAEKARVVWDDGTKSEIVRTPMMWTRSAEIHFEHPDSAKHTSEPAAPTPVEEEKKNDD